MAQVIDGPARLKALFGTSGDITKLVKDFDFSKIDVKDSSAQDFLKISLAPSFGNLKDGTAIKALDDNLKIMIVASTKAIEALPVPERNFDNLVSAMLKNPLIEPHPEAAIAKDDALYKEGTSGFKFDGAPDPAIVTEVTDWIKRFIADDDVWKSISFSPKDLGDIVAQTGATVDSFETFFAKNEEHEKTVLDIGVLRYPDLDHPFFKLYRIELKAYSQSSRVLMVQHDRNGIVGKFNSRKFVPRKSVMEGLAEGTRKKAIAEAEALLA